MIYYAYYHFPNEFHQVFWTLLSHSCDQRPTPSPAKASRAVPVPAAPEVVNEPPLAPAPPTWDKQNSRAFGQTATGDLLDKLYANELAYHHVSA